MANINSGIKPAPIVVKEGEPVDQPAAQDPVAQPAPVITPAQTTTPAAKPTAPATPAAPTAPTAPAAATQAKQAVPTVQEELAKLRETLSNTTQSFLSTIDTQAKRLSSGPDGVAMDIGETHRAQAAIFRAIQYLITTTADKEFNAAMYTLINTFKENGASRVGGLSPERVFGAIGYSEQKKTTQWIAGKTDADREWFCLTVVALHMAHERGGVAIKDLRLDALVALPAIKSSEKDQRYINWLLACKPLNY